MLSEPRMFEIMLALTMATKAELMRLYASPTRSVINRYLIPTGSEKIVLRWNTRPETLKY